jgi:Cu/Ag efflux protein CusF
MKKMNMNWQHAAWWLVAALAVPMALSGCFREPAPTEPEQSDHVGWGIYDARGIVVALPADGEDLMLKHEAIPTFRNIEGELVGMNSMQMPFPLGEGVSLEGIEVGDMVAFTFEVDWDPAYFIRSIEVLPEETELDFSAQEVPTVYETGP